GGDTLTTNFVRSLVVIEKGAHVTLIEDHDSEATQVNAALELVAGDETEIDYFKLTHARALHVASLMASVGAKARFDTFAFTRGSALVRNQSFIRFAGEHTQ